MDYEKKYKEALERAKRFMSIRGVSPEEDPFVVAKELCEEIFPELAESEDERIRKMCITAVNIAASTDGGLLHHEASECLAWLEEQKDKNCLACDQHLKGYLAGRKVTEEERQKEQKPAEWSKEDEHRRKDAIYFLDSAKKHYADTSEIEKTIDWLFYLRPQPKVDEEEIKKIRSEEYTNGFNDCLLGRQKGWSEEDEKMIKSILFVLESYVSQSESASSPSLITSYPTYYKEIDWLKSLRPSWKPAWKPSEKEIIASEKTCKNCGFYENNCPYIRGKFIPYPSKVCKDYTYSVIKAQEQSSEDLEKAAEELFETMEIQEHENIFEDTFKKIFLAGAEWQMKQDHDRCYQCEKNRDTVYWKGWNDCKAKMLKDAVEGVMIGSIRVKIMAPLNAVIEREGLEDGDKVKVIIVKED